VWRELNGEEIERLSQWSGGNYMDKKQTGRDMMEKKKKSESIKQESVIESRRISSRNQKSKKNL